MKKIKVERCVKCPYYQRSNYEACLRLLTDINTLQPDCPLSDDTTQEDLDKAYQKGYNDAVNNNPKCISN